MRGSVCLVAEVGHAIVAKSSALPTKVVLTSLTAYMVTSFEPFDRELALWARSRIFDEPSHTDIANRKRVSEKDQAGSRESLKPQAYLAVSSSTLPEDIDC